MSSNNQGGKRLASPSITLQSHTPTSLRTPASRLYSRRSSATSSILSSPARHSRNRLFGPATTSSCGEDVEVAGGGGVWNVDAPPPRSEARRDWDDAPRVRGSDPGVGEGGEGMGEEEVATVAKRPAWEKPRGQSLALRRPRCQQLTLGKLVLELLGDPASRVDAPPPLPDPSRANRSEMLIRSLRSCPADGFPTFVGGMYDDDLRLEATLRTLLSERVSAGPASSSSLDRIPRSRSSSSSLSSSRS